MPRTCVLICTYNRDELLDGALRSLASCDPRPNSVIVVNGGDERADGVIHKWSMEGLPIKGIKTENVNLSVSRNVGLKHIESEIVAMTDDDAEVFPDWIGQIERAH